MKKIVHKAFMDFEKEEQWLNRMAGQGWAMTDYTWCRYAFESCAPGAYQYRIELLDNLASHQNSRNYIRFVEDTGAEQVASYGRWVYFRKDASAGSFNLYSDLDSRIRHYRRVFQFWMALALAELTIGFSNVSIGLGALGRGEGGYNLFMGLPLAAIGILFLVRLALPMRAKILSLKKEQEIRE